LGFSSKIIHAVVLCDPGIGWNVSENNKKSKGTYIVERLVLIGGDENRDGDVRLRKGSGFEEIR
jgi:two-component sensor histidine kinase